uniref:Uncharacterized protein n=1 Tax=Caenorhabditis japonica TaxID=281687 RepID=A0A8R1IFZ3_CAEJA
MHGLRMLFDKSMVPLKRIHERMDCYQYEDILENTMRHYGLFEMTMTMTLSTHPSTDSTVFGFESDRTHVGRAQTTSEKGSNNQRGHGWKAISLSVIDTLLDSMPRRCQAVLDAKGFATKY